MAAFFFAAGARALPGAARRAPRPASTPRSPHRPRSGMSGMTDTDLEMIVANESSVPRNRPNLIVRNPLLINVEHPSFEHFKGAGQCIPSQVYAVTTVGLTAYLNTAINTAFGRIDPNVANGGRLRQVVAASELTVIAGIQYEDLSDHNGINFDPPTPSDLFTASSSFPRSPASTARAPTRTPRSCSGRRSTSSACSPSPRSRTRSRSLRCSTSRTNSAPPPSSRRKMIRRPSSLGSSATLARA